MLTDIHIKIYKFIQLYVDTNGHSPTFREIQKFNEIGSLSTVHKYLGHLKELEYIDWEAKKSRSIVVK